MINYLIDNQWKWSNCSLPIRRHLPKGNESEGDGYLYQIINCEEEEDPQENFKINLEKPFPFEPETGFVWHKSWNIPEVSLNISEEEFEFLSSEYKHLNCEIMAVYPIKHGNSYYLNEVPLEGACNKTVTEASLPFKFLKFSQTSFNHNRNKFCLMLWFSGENHYGDKDDIFCLISSPIYVDSRKQARKKQAQSTKPVTNLHCPKKFIAPIGGSKNAYPNSSDGFLEYFGAPNIRNKIKHPFYISYHFDKVFVLYRNTSVEGVGLIEALECINSPVKQPADTVLFTLVIMETEEKLRKRIISMLEKWKFASLEFSHPDNKITEKWEIVPKDDLRNSYRLYYENEITKESEKAAKEATPQAQEGAINPIEKREEKVEDNFEHRTVIQLGRPRKMVKLQYQRVMLH